MKQLRFKPSRLALCVALAANTVATGVYASEPAFTLEEIVVYAQKREQSIMDVPIAVSTYSSDTIQQAQIRDASDLQQLAPSLSVNTSSGSSDTSFTIRGIGTAGNNAGFEQSVGVFIDGVYRGRSGSALTDYVDIEAVEILKGPQGTLFGRNTSAGVINVRTKKPSYESSGSLSASLANEGYQQFKGSSTGALVDDVLAYRVSGSWQQRDGIYDNITTGEDINDRDRHTLRGQLLWDINEDASLRIIGDYSKSDEKCCAATAVFYGDGVDNVKSISSASFLDSTPGSYQGHEGGYVDTYARKIALNSDVKETLTDWGLSGELNWDFEDTALTAIASYRVSDNFNAIDADFGPADILSRETTQNIDETSLEIRWASTGANTLDWTAGFYYFNQNIDYNSPIGFGADTQAYLDVYSAQILDNFIGIPGFAPGIISTLEDTIGEDFYAADHYDNTHSDYNAESVALFGQTTWNVDDKLSLTLGLRYSKEDKTSAYHNQADHPYAALTGAEIDAALLASSDPVIGLITGIAGTSALTELAQAMQLGLPYDDFSSDYDDNDLSGTISANYNWSEELSSYARLAKGYKAGGLNQDRSAGNQQPGSRTPDPSAPVFAPETVNSLEFGLKSRWLDHRLQLNAAVFYQQMDDFQFQAFTGTGFVVQNAAKVNGKGIELDYSFKPNAHWLFSGGLTLQNIEYGEFESGPITLAQDDADIEFQDLSGAKVINTSDISYSGNITYKQPIGNGLKWLIATNYSYRSEYFTHESNEPILEQDPTFTVNLVTTLAAADDQWAIDLWGKNITDEEQSYVGFETTFQPASYSTYINAGPTWGVTGRLNF